MHHTIREGEEASTDLRIKSYKEGPIGLLCGRVPVYNTILDNLPILKEISVYTLPDNNLSALKEITNFQTVIRPPRTDNDYF